VTRLTHEVSDEEVEEQLQELRRQHASERSVERGLARGDVLIADLQRLDDGGVPIIGDRYEERYFLIGDENAPSPEFEEALIGIEAGAERRVRFQYREDLPNEDLAGTRAHFAVTAREIRERTLPELDDDFAREVGDRFESLHQFRDHLQGQLEERWRYLAQQKLRSDVIEGLHRSNEVELSESLVGNYLESMRRERERQEHGHEHDHEHEHEHDHEHEHEQPTAEERDAAVKRLKTYLIVEGLRSKISVEVTDEEFESYLTERARQLGIQIEKLKRSPRAADLRRDLEEDKIFEYLEERAVVEERAV
jgi:trigger factor